MHTRNSRLRQINIEIGRTSNVFDRVSAHLKYRSMYKLTIKKYNILGIDYIVSRSVFSQKSNPDGS